MLSWYCMVTVVVFLVRRITKGLHGACFTLSISLRTIEKYATPDKANNLTVGKYVFLSKVPGF
jgi:hypothetical protein